MLSYVNANPAAVVKVNNIEFSEAGSNEDIIAGARFTQGISTHYGILQSKGLKIGINEEENIYDSHNSIDNMRNDSNILNSTSRDLKVSPFIHVNKIGRYNSNN